MAAGAGDVRDEQDGGTPTAVERVLVLVGSGSLGCIAAAVVAGAYCHALAVGVRNGLFGEADQRESDYRAPHE